MSSNNNTTSLVPILNGTNYAQWAVAIKAFLMSTALWAYPQGHVYRAEFPDKKVHHILCNVEQSPQYI